MTKYHVFSMLHHLNERPSYWNMVEASIDDVEEPLESPILGTGLTREDAIADFKIRTGLNPAEVEVVIVGIDNTNCDIPEMLENSPPWER